MEEREDFTGNVDVDLKIMMELDNKDLVEVCATSAKLHKLCNEYPYFWMNKFIKDYGREAAKYKPKERSWKNHYMQTFIDLQKYAYNPMSFLFNIAWKNSPDDSFYIDWRIKQLVPLRQAPEWVMTNLWLLNLGDIRVATREPKTDTRYHNIKPVELLKKIPVPPGQKEKGYVYGFLTGDSEKYRPTIISYSQLQNVFENWGAAL